MIQTQDQTLSQRKKEQLQNDFKEFLEDLEFIRNEVFQKEFDQDILVKKRPPRASVALLNRQENQRDDDEDPIMREWQCIKYLQQQIWLTSLPKIFDIVASITIEASKSDKDSRKMSNLVDRSLRTQFYNLFKMKPSNEEDKKDL